MAIRSIWCKWHAVAVVESAGEIATLPAVKQVRGWRAAAFWLVGRLVRAWCRTLRFEISAADRAVGNYRERPIISLLWHNRLFVVPWARRVLRGGRPIYALVSASRDGADLSKVLECVGIRSVRGSSSRFGREALHELIACQREGNDLAVTPDGPRGPLYDLKAGALLAARRTGAPLLLLGFEFENAWRMRSWDRFYVPKPFSRVIVHCELVDPYSLGHGNEAVARLRQRLLEINRETADA